jgi:GT2 family glycosyltransferase
MDSPPFLLFVVPTFNRAADLPRTLAAIAAQRWPSDRMAILVVDNASTDDTPLVLARLATELPCRLDHLRKAPEGPTVARNLGMRAGRDGLVVLVDSDVELDPGWAEATVAALLGDSRIAQVGGKLVFAHDRVILNSYGGAISLLGLAWDDAEGERADAFSMPVDTLWVNTAAVLVRPEALLGVGGFDESFFYGYEEPDLGLRLAIAGWRSVVVPDAIAVHHTDVRIGESAAEIVFHYTKNRFRMGIKVLAPIRLAAFLAASMVYGLLDAAMHPPRLTRLRAMIWNATNFRESWMLRQRAQAARRVSDRRALALVSSRLFPPRRLAGLRRRPVSGSAIVRSAADDRVAS